MRLTIEAMPAYNEAHAISNIVLGYKKYFDKVVVIDDGSSDSTLEITIHSDSQRDRAEIRSFLLLSRVSAGSGSLLLQARAHKLRFKEMKVHADMVLKIVQI
jgi:glycosyltransferase involved in cell wall biosynthesis